MYDTKETVLSARGSGIYKTLLFLYPESYRKRFGKEMFFAFRDMYQKELEKHGRIRLGFWFSIVLDTTESVITQHMHMIKKQGLINYLNISKYNVIGTILLLPYILLFGLDFIGRVVQGDFTHYNKAFYSALSHTILYSTYNGQALLLWTILIVAPLVAILINLIPVLSMLVNHKKKLTIRGLFFANPLAIVIMGVGFLFLLIAVGHDAVPCLFNHLFSNGLENIGKTISVCKNA